MILILSTSYDYDTQIVIDWLRHLNIDFIRINDEDLLFGDSKIFINVLRKSESHFIACGKKILFSQINVVWFRKFGFLNSYKKHYGSNSDVFKFMNRELIYLRETLCNELKRKFWLYDKNVGLNKIKVLQNAKNCGLNISPTFISNNNQQFIENKNLKNKTFITKAIGETSNINEGKYNAVMYTKEVDFINLKQSFAISLLQEKIEKDYEIRTFFIGDCFYSMAVFSQNNTKTAQDFRNYDADKPNRFVAYKLPISIEIKLARLNKKLKLNTGSIDLIKSKNQKYYFLEINPAGQFGMTSIPCNYNLHKIIALFLNHENEKIKNK
jgi:ATP-GRASP peptide maturase of grasp-with-spasm system